MTLENKQATESDALLELYRCINGTIKACPKYVQYNRSQIDAALDVIKQLMVIHGYEFRSEK